MIGAQGERRKGGRGVNADNSTVMCGEREAKNDR